jgi:hypothetical protein
MISQQTNNAYENDLEFKFLIDRSLYEDFSESLRYYVQTRHLEKPIERAPNDKAHELLDVANLDIATGTLLEDIIHLKKKGYESPSSDQYDRLTYSFRLDINHLEKYKQSIDRKLDNENKSISGLHPDDVDPIMLERKRELHRYQRVLATAIQNLRHRRSEIIRLKHEDKPKNL